MTSVRLVGWLQLMQVNRPKEYRPQLADASKPQSKEEQMRQQLGLGADEVGAADDDDEAPPAPARRGGGGAAGGSDKRLAELETKNAELEKKLANEGTRRDEQVETIKKLANSRMANITKSFEEKLAAKERELEEVSASSAGDAEQLASLLTHVSSLEEQLQKAGVQPVAAPSGGGSEDRLLGEIERLRKENNTLRSKPSSNGSGGGNDGEVKELKKTIDNLMEANSKLVSNTKSKIALLETELERYKSSGGGGAGAGAGAGGGDSGAGSAQIAKMQKILEEESNERKKAVDEVARLRKELDSSSASVAKASGDSSAQVKELQKNTNELSKQLGHKDAQLKAQLEDFALKEKDLNRQLKALEEEKTTLEKTGAAKQQETRSKIKKAGRKVLQDLAKLKAASLSTREACVTLNDAVMPEMKTFYQPLKKQLKLKEQVCGYTNV
jgi:SMC interacting uncharacterized protein involved in chromosome segregation